MQTLWARATPLRCTCSCTPGHTATTTLTHRTTSAVIKRRLRFRDLFTVFYSSVLATAAIADTGRKEAKRVELERLIREAKDDLQNLEEQQQTRVAAISLHGNEATQESAPHRDSWDKVFQWATMERARRKALGFHDLKGIPLDELKDLSAPEVEFLMFDKYIARLNSADGAHLWNPEGPRRKLSIKKIKTIEWSIRKLIHRLILSSLERSETLPEPAQDQTPVESQLRPLLCLRSDQLKMKLASCENHLEFLSKHSERVHWDRFESPKAPIYSRHCNIDVEPAASLNVKLHQIFKTCFTHSMEKDALVTRICSALLFSYVPPDVHSYNLLIICLTRLKQVDDVQAVITSMRESHIEPNEVTLSAMAHFYTETNDRRAFLGLVRMMEGYHGGLGLYCGANVYYPMFERRYRITESQPRQTSISEDQKNYFYEPEDDNTRPLEPAGNSTQKIVKTAEMSLLNRIVYSALIHGAARFLGPEQARNYYRRMVGDGWEPGARELTSILQRCSEQLEWHDGLAVWQELCNLPQGAPRLSLVWMLQLCRKRAKYIEFGEVLDYAVRHKLIPSTIWYFPDRIRECNVSGLLRSADVLLSARQLALPVTIACEFLERSLEALGYRIARSALDYAEISPDVTATPSNCPGLDMYLRIRQLHRDSPSRSLQRARDVALGCLADKSREHAMKHITSGQNDEAKRIVPLSCNCCGAEFSSVTKLNSHLLLCSEVYITSEHENGKASSNNTNDSSTETSGVISSSISNSSTFVSRKQAAAWEADCLGKDENHMEDSEPNVNPERFSFEDTAIGAGEMAHIEPQEFIKTSQTLVPSQSLENQTATVVSSPSSKTCREHQNSQLASRKPPDVWLSNLIDSIQPTIEERDLQLCVGRDTATEKKERQDTQTGKPLIVPSNDQSSHQRGQEQPPIEISQIVQPNSGVHETIEFQATSRGGSHLWRAPSKEVKVRISLVYDDPACYRRIMTEKPYPLVAFIESRAYPQADRSSDEGLVFRRCCSHRHEVIARWYPSVVESNA